VPPEWYGGDIAEIERLMETLLKRRGRVRELIASFRESNREPFPFWGKSETIAMPKQFADVTVAGRFVM